MSDVYLERRGDEVHLVGEPTECIKVAADLLLVADPRWMTVEDDVLTLTLTNGTWRYRIARSSETTYVGALLPDEP